MKTNKLLAATLAIFVSVGAYAQTVDEIVAKHITALGGQDKLNGVKTVMTDRSLSVKGMDIPNITTIVVGKSMRNESTVMGNSMVQVIDGNTGWMIRPAMMGGTGDPEDMPADVMKQSMSQLSPFGVLVDYKNNGTNVELVGKEQIDKKDVYHLRVTPKDGQAIDEYLDATTYLVSKVKTSVGGVDGEIIFSDYEDVDGVKFPETMEIVGGQMGTLTFTTNKIVVNGPINEAIFKKPAK